MKMTIRKDNYFNRHYRDEHCQIHKLKLFRFPKEVFKHSPYKIRNGATPMYLKVSDVASTFCPSLPRRNETRNRALRLCCVGRGGESATPQPMDSMARRGTLRRGGNFLGCRGRIIATVFEKKFF